MSVEASSNIAVGYYRESQFTKPRPDCPLPRRWHTRDIQATEIEVVEMVAGMIRGLQPDVVLETGTSRGFMTLAIAEALEKNDQGVVITYEPVAETMTEALRTWDEKGGPESLPIIPRECGSMDFPWKDGPIDFAWHDSLLRLRLPEFEFYREHYSDRAVVCFHDTAPHFGAWSDELRLALMTAGFSYLDMPTPRGCIIARKNP